MSIIPFEKPTFLAANCKDIKFHKYMFIRRNGIAIHKTGNLSRNCYPVELICISNEDENNWIGNYAEGFGFFGVRFRKEDCREASDEEIQMWLHDRNSIEF